MNIDFKVNRNVVKVIEFLVPGLPLAILIIDLEGNEDSENHENDFSYSIKQVLGELVFFEKALTDLSKKAYHFSCV